MAFEETQNKLDELRNLTWQNGKLVEALSQLSVNGLEVELQQGKEAIVNAICHRDYTSNASVQVMLFRDRLEVWNPGTLPYGLTVQKLHGPHKSLPANPLLADPMYWNGYIEKVGTGTEDIINKCREYGLKTPEFYQEEDFRVVIWRSYNEESVPMMIQQRSKAFQRTKIGYWRS